MDVCSKDPVLDVHHRHERFHRPSLPWETHDSLSLPWRECEIRDGDPTRLVRSFGLVSFAEAFLRPCQYFPLFISPTLYLLPIGRFPPTAFTDLLPIGRFPVRDAIVEGGGFSVRNAIVEGGFFQTRGVSSLSLSQRRFYLKSFARRLCCCTLSRSGGWKEGGRKGGRKEGREGGGKGRKGGREKEEEGKGGRWLGWSGVFFGDGGELWLRQGFLGKEKKEGDGWGFFW